MSDGIVAARSHAEWRDYIEVFAMPLHGGLSDEEKARIARWVYSRYVEEEA